MSLSDAARIAIADANFATNFITAGVATWIGYDYLLTVRRESRLFWKRKVTAASILFFVNRYLALFYYVGLAYYSRAKLPYPGYWIEYQCQASCRLQSLIELGIRYFEYFPWAALRVHALGQKNWFLTTFTFFWSVLAFPVDYYGDFHHRTYAHDPVLGCTGFIRGGQIIADVVVIGVTWKATYAARREGSVSSLMKVMFKNGTVYFILTAILVSHFILDLHETHRALGHQGSDLSTLQIMSLDIAQPYSNGSEYLEDWAVALNPTLSRTESESGSENGPASEELGGSPIPHTNGHLEAV
ncbi:hypothetical protein V8D89_007196 [Ganoderma adspersum]